RIILDRLACICYTLQANALADEIVQQRFALGPFQFLQIDPRIAGAGHDELSLLFRRNVPHPMTPNAVFAKAELLRRLRSADAIREHQLDSGTIRTPTRA